MAPMVPPSFTTAMEENELVAGGFGFVSQSGALGAYWLDLVLRARLGVSSWITTGNECDVDLASTLGMLVADEKTRVIGAYIEDIKDGAGFRNALRDAARACKPVFLIKVGRSSAGAAAAASHTGTIAGEDRVYQACFDQYGAVRVASVTEMIDAAKLVLHRAIPTQGRIGVLSVSGGAGVMLADVIEGARLELPSFSPDTANALAATLPGFSKLRNPVDLTANVLSNTGMFRRTLGVVGAAPEIDACILFIGLMHSISDRLAQSVLDARKATGRPFIVVWIGARPEVVQRLDAAGIPVYPDIPEAVRAVSNAGCAQRLRAGAAALGDGPEPATAASSARQLTEWQSKKLLRAVGGAEIPEGVLVASADAVAPSLVGLTGPFAAKLQSPDMPHKSEHGGVILGLADAAAAAAAVDTLLGRGRQAGVPCDGVLVERMVPFDAELIAGLRRDAVFGALLMVGRGGVEVELAPDVAIGLLPLRENEIAALIRSLRCARPLEGFRGRPQVDVAALARTLAHLGQRFLADPALLEIEINPLVLRGDKATALDALVKVSA